MEPHIDQYLLSTCLFIIDDLNTSYQNYSKKDLKDSFRSQKQSISNSKLCNGGSILEYRENYERELMNEGDNPPIGIVLCADKSESVVKYTLPENET